ncbi:MAG: HlyC/CorC family transporter [Chitinispirillaceae bacterium]|nr:HlyC/CorC family transporter [Chitinispirillaceae bacterium]
MEGDPSIVISVSLLLLTFFLSVIFSVVKIVFLSFETTSLPADDEYLRYYGSKIEHVLKNEPLFEQTVAFGRILSYTGLSLFTYLVCAHLYPQLPVYQRIIAASSASILILAFFAGSIQQALAKRYYRNFVAFCYNAYKFIGWIFLPLLSFLIWVHNKLLKITGYDERFAFLSDDDKARISEKHNGERLDEEEKEMIRGIFDLSETTIDEIMVPRIDIQGFDITTSVEQVLKIVREEGHSRLPVFKETVDTIVGVLYVKDILNWVSEHGQDRWDIEKIMKKPLYVPVGKKVNDLMRDFKKTHMHIAVVVDEYGGTAGLVTMEDILEEIVGDIQDEYDEEEKEVVKLSENSYLVDPHIDLEDLNDELGINISHDEVEYNTLSGLIYHEYGNVPQKNTTLEYNGLRFIILEMDNQRIVKVKVEIVQRQSKPQDTAIF